MIAALVLLFLGWVDVVVVFDSALLMAWVIRGRSLSSLYPRAKSL